MVATDACVDTGASTDTGTTTGKADVVTAAAGTADVGCGAASEVFCFFFFRSCHKYR